MTAIHRRYVAIESGIGAAISAVLSLAFCFIVFGGEARVPVAGVGGLIFDALPQSFLVALMSSLVPTLLTRRRVRQGRVARREGRCRLPRHVAVRSLLFALAATVVGVSLTFAVLSFGAADRPFTAVVIAKTLFGALFGGLVAALATRAALADA